MMVEDFSMYARGGLSRSLREEPQVLEKVWPHPHSLGCCHALLRCGFSVMCVLFVCQERLESLVFGLLRQRKLDFLEIYSDEIMVAAKAVVAQVTRW